MRDNVGWIIASWIFASLLVALGFKVLGDWLDGSTWRREYRARRARAQDRRSEAKR